MMWEQHRDLILAAVILATIVLLLQGVLITVLLVRTSRMRRAERALAESEQRWRGAFEASVVGAALVDGDNDTDKFLAANPALWAMLGYADDALRGLTPHDLTVEDDREAAGELHRALKRGQQQHGELETRWRRKDGTAIPVHLYLSMIPGDAHGPRLLLATVLEITARKLAEDAMRVAQSELADVARLTTVGEMTALIAHEVNQPLGAVVANANAGLRWLGHATPNLEETRAALKRIVHEGHRASKVITGIRGKFKKEGRARTPLDVNVLVREVLALARSELQNQRIAVRVELADRLPQVLVDRAQVRHALLDLLVNAIDAMDARDGRARILQLRSEPHGTGSVMLTVEDTGTGFDEKSLAHIFEAFFTTKSDRMGMGLTICRSIVESHGGRVSASQGHPCGAVFQVALPGHPPGAE
jgi:PAS domain S-box-containing protein